MRGKETRPRLPEASVATSGSPPSAASKSSSTAGSVSSSAVVSFVNGFAIAPRTPPVPAAADIVTFRCMTPSSPMLPASTGAWAAWETTSSSVVPYRWKNVAPWLCPWSERTTT
jgi:hypothetical protein